MFINGVLFAIGVVVVCAALACVMYIMDLFEELTQTRKNVQYYRDLYLELANKKKRSSRA